MVVGYCGYLWMLFREDFPLNLFVFAAVELFFTLFDTWNALRQCFFLLHTLLLFVFLTVRHLGDLKDSLSIAVKQSTLKMFQFRYLDHFYSEYRTLLNFAYTINQSLVSQLLFTIFASNMAINLVIIGNLLFRPLYRSEQLVMLAIVVLQTVLILSACLGLTIWSDFFGQSDRLLYRAQLILLREKGDHVYRKLVLITAKLKLAAFYETVCTRDEFRFTLGYLGKINSKSLYEFIVVYTGVVMYVAKMVRRGRL